VKRARCEQKMVESAVRSVGDQAGVFEYDGDTGHFYLYKPKGEKDQKVKLGEVF
jgi:hypothetical protein